MLHYVWYSWNSGFIYHGPHGILELWSIFDGIWIHGIIYVCLGYILIPVVWLFFQNLKVVFSLVCVFVFKCKS